MLKRCPFQQEATTYPSVICPIHLGLIRGALTELGTGVEADWLKPFAEPSACVGHLTPRVKGGPALVLRTRI